MVCRFISAIIYLPNQRRQDILMGKGQQMTKERVVRLPIGVHRERRQRTPPSGYGDTSVE